MDINECYKYIQLLAQKEQKGFIKPTDFNLAMDAAQMEFINDRFGQPAEFTANRPSSRIAFPQSQKVLDDLRELSTTTSLSSPFILPSDYLYTLSISDVTTTTSVKWVTKDQALELINSTMLAPDATRPIAWLDDNDSGDFKVSPLSTVHVQYLKRPSKPVWAYTTNAQNQLVYDSGNSTQLDLREQTHLEICMRALEILGVNLKDQAIQQFATSKQTKTEGV